MTRTKLGSRRGSAILIALIALLVAALVSAVVINAAVGNMFRIEGNRKAEQAYLTASSAARLISGGLRGDKVTFKKVWTTTQAYTRTSSTAPWVKSGSEVSGSEHEEAFEYKEAFPISATNPANPFGALLLSWIEADPYGESTTPQTSTLTLSFDEITSGGETIKLDDVEVNLKMEQRTEGSNTYKYNISGSLKLGSSAFPATENYKLELTANTMLKDPQPVGLPSVSVGPVIEDSPGSTEGTSTITYAQKYVIEFPDMVITKGL